MQKYKKIVHSRKYDWKSKKSIFYRIDWRNRKLVDLHKWFISTLPELKDNAKFMQKVRDFSNEGDIDKRVVSILRYVARILTYVFCFLIHYNSDD